MSSTTRRLLESRAPTAVILIRIAVGWVFVSEGIQKFLYPAALGVGRFAKIGIPAPETMGPFVGAVEIVCGALVLVGLLTRFAALVLIANMFVAIVSTKVPILLGYGYWMFSHSMAPKTGIWSFLHESRTDFSMLIGSLFLLFVGGGWQSLDARLLQRAAGAGVRVDGR